MAEYDLGLVVGSDGAKGDKGDKGDKGAKGDAGKGITSIQKTSSSGKVDTYTITYSDGSTSTFTVTNGSDASVTVDSSLSSTSVNPVQNKVIKTALDGKADGSDIPTKTSDLTNDGDGTNPFLTQHQSLASKTVTVEKQATAESGYFATYVIKQNNAQVGSKINIPKDYLVKSGSVKTCSTANVPVQGYVVGDKYIDFVVNTKDSSGTDEHIYILVSDLVDVPVDWSDIENKPSSFTPSSHNHTASDITDFPSIPTKTSDLTNDSGFLTSHQDITGKEDNSNKVSNWSSTTNNTRYPSEKLVKDSLDGKANSTHTHSISDVSSLQSSLDGKASTSHTHTKSQITDFPTMPSKTSDLTNDGDGTNAFLTQHQSLSNYVQKSSTTGLLKNDGTVDTTTYLPSSSYVPYYYATCATAAATQDKVVTITDFTLETGVVLVVKFTNSNTYNGTARLKINSLAAIDIAIVGATKTSRYHWTAGEAVTFVYDGANFVMINTGIATTSYYGVTKLSSSTNSTSASLAATPAAVKAAYDLASSKADPSDIPANTSDLTNDSGFITSAAIADMLTSNDIVNNLTTTTAGKVLDARQGKALADLIGDAITYINQ